VSVQREGVDGRPTTSARLFFALWPDAAMQSALDIAASPAVAEAQGADSGVRRIPAANFHLTLAFLGSVPLRRLDELQAVAVRCAKSAAPIDVVLDTIEHWREPQVLVATAATTPPGVVLLAENLQRALIDAGFSPDVKFFRVHATLARKLRRVPCEWHIEPVHWRFESVQLIESRTHPAGSAYHCVAKFQLEQIRSDVRF